MKGSCSGSDRRDLIGGIIIGVPNKDVGEADEGNDHYIDDDSTCISALSCSERSREPRYQQRPSQGTTRRPHPFPWAASEDISDDVPHISNEAELMDHGTKSSPTAAADHTYRQLRRSTLVANESVHDASWFAARKLMSNASLDKFFEEEMKKEVAQEAAKKKPRRRQARRASTGMSEMHNEQFVIEFAPSLSGGVSPSRMKSQTLSESPTVLSRKKSLSLDDGLDKLVQSFISSFRDGDEQRNRTSALLIQSKLSKSNGETKVSLSSGQPKALASGLSSEELQVLTNMMRRLSHSDSDRYSEEQQERCDVDIPNSVGSENRILSTDKLPRSNDHPDIDATLKNAASAAQTQDKAHLQRFDPVSFSSEAFDTKLENESPYARDLDMPVLRRKQSDSVHETSLSRFQSASTAAAVVSEADEFFRTMKEFDDQMDQQKISNSDFSGSTMSQTRSSSPTSSSPKVLSPEFSSSALLSTAMTNLDGPPLKQDCGDLLAEGIDHLSMAMLVNIYGKLREMSLLGHVSVKLRDIDVNSHQYNSRKKELKRLGEWTAADEAKGYLDNTRKAGFIVRSVMDEAELLEAEHARGGQNEFNHALLKYDASLLKDFKTWVEESRVKQLDTATECIIKKIRKECAQRQTAREEMMSSKHSLPFSGTSNNSLRLARRRGSLMNVSESFQGASWMKQERKLIEDHFGVKNDLPISRRNSFCRDNLPGELSGSMIAKAFFEEGSVMKNLLESGFEVVWFADRHPSDIIYGICVNRQTSTVTVVFRGQESVLDLCCNTAMSSFPNPVAHEDYEGNSEHIKLRSVVADELLRVRMDTKMSLISEIREKVVIIGQELTKGAGYHLSVVGHSRGGGYATVLGYYLASDMYLELASSVRVFTFASSPVGCEDFQKGFKHLEEEGRLVYARFANSNDLFTSLPLRGFSEENNTKVKYHHVGMQVRLHKASEAGRRRIKKSLDVSYGVTVPILLEMARAVRNLLSMVLTKNYCISQYHLRMHFAREYRLALGDGALRFDRKRKCLKSLNEYYVMKCLQLQNNMGLKENRTLMPTWAVLVLVVSLLYVQVDILLKFAGL